MSTDASLAATQPIRSPDERVSSVRWIVVVCLSAGVASLVGWAAAQSGGKLVLALVGGIAGLVAVSLTSRRTELGLAGLGLSLIFLLHKSIGPQDPMISSGPISIYVTSFDLVIAALWVNWFVEGDVGHDLVETLRRPATWLPLLGALLLSLSIVLAQETFLALGEMARMCMLWLTYVFLGARLRTHRDFGTVLWALAAVAAVQVVVVVLQWRTGGVLGLDFLGIPTELGERTADTRALGRPFGTAIHPVFLGALLGTIGTTAAAFAIHLTDRRLRLAATLTAVGVLLPLALAQARAATVAYLAAVGLLVLHGLATRRVSLRVLAGILGVLVLLALPVAPRLMEGLASNFGTDHFFLEIESRMELNDVAVRMWQDHPELGVGLNNFEQEMAPYDRGLIFGGHPVHNLVLLVMAESGIIGLIGMVLTTLALAVPALQLLRTREPVFRATGAAMCGVLVFFLLEEQLGFSLRQDQPRAAFWIIAGCSLAASRLAAQQPTSPSAVPSDPPRLPGPPPTQTHQPQRRWRRLTPSSWLRRRERASHAPDAPPAPHRASVRPGTREQRPHDLTSSPPPVSPPPVSPPRGSADRRGRGVRRPRVARSAGAVLAVVAVVAGTALVTSTSVAGPDPFSDVRIVVTGVERGTGMSGVFLARGDGQLQRISPDDGRQYSWASWAPGANAVVWSARANTPDAPENLEVAKVDGSSVREITAAPWRSGQPKWSDDGRSIVFSAFHPEYPQVGIYRIDLTSLEVTNLSAVTQHAGAFDGDPRLTRSGRIVFARGHDDTSGSTVPNQIWSMAGDGTDRRALTDDQWYNTDPDIHPDGTTVAIASYRGEGHPSVQPDPERFSPVRLQDWVLVERNLDTGVEEVLTEGLACFERGPADPCTPRQGPAFVPIYTPSGDGLAYVSVLSRTQTCVCGVDRSTGTGRVLVSSADIAISWFDLTGPEPAPPGLLGDIGAAADESRLLVTGESLDGRPVLRAMRPDGWIVTDIPLPGGIVPEQAVWGDDRSSVLVVARRDEVGTAASPHPAPPAGATRQEHFTLDMLSPAFSPIVQDTTAQELQVLRIDLDTGAVTQLTDPYLEDWRDGLVQGDRRGNTEPVVSPDGSAIVVTNVSTYSGESFLLRLDASGEVLNLTNATSGAVAVADRSANFSPDGDRLVFVGSTGAVSDLYTMDAATGSDVVQLTDDDNPDLNPRWSPDGQRVAYVSYGHEDTGIVLTDDGGVQDAADGTVPLAGWSLLVLDLATGESRVLVDGEVLPSFRPVWSPHGDRLAFIGMSPNGVPNIYLVPSDGSGGAVLQPSLRTHELDLDWR